MVDAVENANVHSYENVEVRVVDPEHLAALALQAGGARRRERAWQLLQSGSVDRARLGTILAKQRDWHQAQARLPLREKVRKLLERQRQDLPLIQRQRTLKPWERPWNIAP